MRPEWIARCGGGHLNQNVNSNDAAAMSVLPVPGGSTSSEFDSPCSSERVQLVGAVRYSSNSSIESVAEHLQSASDLQLVTDKQGLHCPVAGLDRR